MITATHPSTAVYTFRAQSLVWDAPSDTHAGTVYAVTASAFDAELSCDCPARTTCKHIRRALAGELGKPRCRVVQEPRRPRPTFRLAIPGESVQSFGFISPDGA
jgi:hypothetical protein